MLYHSTRSEAHFVDSAEAVLEGLAPDGGLYMPESIPAFDWQACLRGSSTEMSAKILAALLPDIPDMDTLVRRAYQGKFETEDLTPTVSVGGYSVLELFRGLRPLLRTWLFPCCPSCSPPRRPSRGWKRIS